MNSCRFGSTKCRYIHTECRYDVDCTNENCFYSHSPAKQRLLDGYTPSFKGNL